MDRWYEPPVSFDGLARTFRAAIHHSSPIAVKCNILTSTYIPHPLLSQQAFSRFVQDYLVFGNAYLEKRTNRLGGVLSLEPALAKYTRRGVDLNTYWFVQYGLTTQPYEFTQGNIFHLLEPDINQEIYGLPGYLSAIPSTLLNESATLFRRKYYINGSHAGFIMYMTDAAQNPGGREQYPPGNEKRQRAGQLPQSVYVFAQRQKGRHPDHPVIRGCGER
ncbi:probable capsid portal protein [Salmonella enterica]|nr:probable capsid portal protein [Salmonella enterica]